MMITQHDNNGELSCFKSALLFYLRESHPHMTDDKAFIRERADSAAEAYEHAIRDGLSVRQALELADTVLYQDLRFSRFDTVFDAVSEWFPEVRPERRTDFRYQQCFLHGRYHRFGCVKGCEDGTFKALDVCLVLFFVFGILTQKFMQQPDLGKQFFV